MQALAPLIGITCYPRNEENRFHLPAAYVDAIRRAGGTPVLIPPGEMHLDHLLRRLDGVLFAGGGDIDPVQYMGDQHDTIYGVNADRDHTELALMKVVLREAIPLLAICRGLQVLNVALNGDLVQHVPDMVDSAIPHRANPNGPERHEVHIERNSQLVSIFGQSKVTTTSWHHQAVRRLGTGLQVAARSADGIIEAIELPDNPNVLAVQWHPEMSANIDPIQQKLFDHFVAHVRQRSLATGAF